MVCETETVMVCSSAAIAAWHITGRMGHAVAARCDRRANPFRPLTSSPGDAHDHALETIDRPLRLRRRVVDGGGRAAAARVDGDRSFARAVVARADRSVDP